MFVYSLSQKEHALEVSWHKYIKYCVYSYFTPTTHFMCYKDCSEKLSTMHNPYFSLFKRKIIMWL